MFKAALILLVFAVSPGAAAQSWESTVARVIDGDTFQLSRPLVRIRLCGVDTPEKGQRGYREATRFTRALVSGHKVFCRTVGEGTPVDFEII